MILVGDNRALLRGIEAKSVQMCVTSPPYFGLRDYGHDDQIGQEETVDEYVANLVSVFREVWRVLKDDGTLWLNLGDSYAGSGKGPAGNLGKKHNERDMSTTKHSAIVPAGTKPKDLIGIPWLVAFALRADGWYLRQDIIWHKPNVMPESVRDRCTKAHEYLFLLTKSPKYYYDADAIKEPCVSTDARPRDRDKTQLNVVPGRSKITGLKHNNYETRNKRSVWVVPPVPFKGAHFATYPPRLIEPCVLAGSRPGDLILDPFGGAGTTGLVAQNHNRRFVLCELNPHYAALALDRIYSK